MLPTAHKEAHNYLNYTAALPSGTLAESLEKELIRTPSFTVSGSHLFSLWPSFPGLVLSLEGSTREPKHHGHFSTVCCYFSFLIIFFHSFLCSPQVQLGYNRSVEWVEWLLGDVFSKAHEGLIIIKKGVEDGHPQQGVMASFLQTRCNTKVKNYVFY